MTTEAITSGGKRRGGSGAASGVPTQRIGWRGVSLEAPEDWSLTSVSGEGPNGYVRVESPDTQFVQIKWWERKGVVSTPDALESYIRDLRKRGTGRPGVRLPGRRSRAGLEWKKGPRSLQGVRPSEQGPVTYSWTSEQRAYGVVWHCGACKRLVIAEVVGGRDDDFSGAAAILRSIREHGEGGWNPWGMYGLFVEVPAAFQIEKHQLMTGFLQLSFRHRARTLLVQRWGLAEIALKGAGLEEWYDYQQRDRLGRYAYRYEETEVCGHPALRLRGRERILPGAVKSLNQLTSLSAPALRIEGRVWQCPESNKIHAIIAQTGRGDTTLDEVVARFRCH